MIIKELACVFLDKNGEAHVEVDDTLRYGTAFWLDKNGLRKVRDKINAILGENKTEPDPNLLIDYLKEQAAEEPFECKEQQELLKKFEEWLYAQPTVLILDWGMTRNEFMLYKTGVLKPEEKFRGPQLGRGQGLLGMMKAVLDNCSKAKQD